MSSNLQWWPVTSGKEMSTDAKFLLRELYGEPIDITLHDEAIKVLKGAMAGTPTKSVKDELQGLMDAIATYGEIHLKEVF